MSHDVTLQYHLCHYMCRNRSVAEAKVYATLKSDTIMVIVVYTDSHADEGERTSYVDEKYLNLNGKIRRF